MSNKFKRVLSLVLSVAMVITGLQLGTAGKKTVALADGVQKNSNYLYFDPTGTDADGHYTWIGLSNIYLRIEGCNDFIGSGTVEVGDKTLYYWDLSNYGSYMNNYFFLTRVADWNEIDTQHWRRTAVSAETLSSARGNVYKWDGSSSTRITSAQRHSNEVYIISKSQDAYAFGNAPTPTPGPTPDGKQRIYFQVPSGWIEAYMYLYNASETSGDVPNVKMQGPDADGYFYADVEKKYTNVIFSNIEGWPTSPDDRYPEDGVPGVDISGSNKKFFKTERYYYAQTDLVDYYNDARIDDGNCSGGMSANSQGEKLGRKDDPDPDNPSEGAAAFSYFNKMISEQGYTNPLYVGALLYPSSRVGRSFMQGDYGSLSNWNTMANVALMGDVSYTAYRKLGDNSYEADPDETYNPKREYGGTNIYFKDARYGYVQLSNGYVRGKDGVLFQPARAESFSSSVQGLVKNTLGDNGKLCDQSGNEFPYFSKTFANYKAWGSNDSENRYLMHYFDNLLFPFKTTGLENGIVRYSYDSATDYSVYYDWNRNDGILQTSSTYHVRNIDGKNGYYPFNGPFETVRVDNETNLDTDRSKVNYGFGTKFTIPFTVNKNGTLNGQSDGEAITFNFTGDDDVWVFLDGKLILDMGGSHTMAKGVINFKDKTATVYHAATLNSDLKLNSNLRNSSASNNPASYSDATHSVFFDGTYSERAWADTADATFPFSTYGEAFTASFDDYTKTHVLTMFYMERGMFDSNMSIDFTITPLPAGVSAGVTVDTSNINPGLQDAVKRIDTFEFPITSGKTPDGFTLQDAAGNKIDSTITGTDKRVTGLRDGSMAYNFTSGTSDAFAKDDTFKIQEDSSKSTILTYDWSKTTTKVIKPDGTVLNGTAGNLTVDLGTLSTGNYNVMYNNIPVSKPVTITKAWEGDAITDLADKEFEFRVELDFDADGRSYEYTPYALYGTGGSKLVDENGILKIKAGESITLPGIPVNASVSVTEIAPEGDLDWCVKGAATQQLTVANSDNNAIVVTNMKKPEQVVYMEAATDVVPDGTITGINDYTVKEGTGDSATDIVITEITAIDGIAVGDTDAESGKTVTTSTSDVDESSTTTLKSTDAEDTTPADLTVTVTVTKDEAENPTSSTISISSPNAGEEYVISYNGTKGTGDEKETVSGKLKVYTYKATKKVYVLDYGLPCDITATESENGLLQDGVFFNEHATGTTAHLKNDFEKKSTDDAQVSISMSLEAEKVEIDKDTLTLKNGCKVVATPQAFMSQVDVFGYSAEIAAGTFVENDPTTGTTVHGVVTVMPASIVYYEDNFNQKTETNDSAVKILYYGTTETGYPRVEYVQSNDQSEQYGHDEAYNNGVVTDSGDASTMMTANGYQTKAVFTFKGTGFDVIARTTGGANATAAISCIVKDSADPENETLVGVIGVDTYYANGSLYQVPVISKTGLPYSTYTVTLGIKETSKSDVVYLDGIRIYNPLGTAGADAYIPNEKGAAVEKISSLLIGSGKITEQGHYDDGVKCLDGQIVDGAQAAIVDYDEDEKKLYPMGSVIVENTKEDASLDNKSILTYLNAGPTNEVYVSYASALAFVAEKTGDNATIQIEAKLMKADPGVELDLCYLDAHYAPHTIETIGTATAMYYEIPVEECIKLGDDKYLVVIPGQTDDDEAYLSFSNLKVNGYELSNPLTDGDALECIETDEPVENVFGTLNEIKKQKRTWVNDYKITLSEDVFNGGTPKFTMCYVKADESRVAMDVTVVKTEGTTYTVKFKTPNATGQFPVEFRYVVNGEESEKYAATIMTVK